MDVLVEKVMYECPMCDERHLVEKRQRMTRSKIKGEIVEYCENYYRCTSSGNIFEFVPAKMMDENLLQARNTYRKAHNMMTSEDIISLRKKYGLTQKEFALMLGWGEITVARYETKLVQDETHDDVLHAVSNDAMEARKYLERNRACFRKERYDQILTMIDAEIERTSVEYYTKKKIEAKYIRYQDDPEANGGVMLDMEKVRNMIAFFAQNCQNLFKVKLMKLLWYSDALFYQRFNCSMSGLVYQHMRMGALPIASFDIMELISYEMIEDDSAQSLSYKILPQDGFTEDVFNDNEKQVLHAVLNKFQHYTGTELSNYMHLEKAYTETKEKEVIPYSLAKSIRLIT